MVQPQQIVEIEGNLIRRIERRILHESNLADIAPFMETRVPVTLPILPRHPVRSVYWDESDETNKTLQLLMEVPPAVRTITYHEESVGPLSMPWTIWHFVVTNRSAGLRNENWMLDDIRIYWSQEQITDLEQQIIPAIMQNVYTDASICFGDTGTDPYQPLPDRIDQIINDFYLSGFNDDLGRVWPWGSDSPETWIDETQRDRSCWKNFPEWDLANANTQHFQLKNVFQHEIDRSAPRSLGNDIPPLTFLPTFGRTREWLEELTSAQRLRLHAEIQAMHTDHPEAFEVATDA